MPNAEKQEDRATTLNESVHVCIGNYYTLRQASGEMTKLLRLGGKLIQSRLALSILLRGGYQDC